MFCCGLRRSCGADKRVLTTPWPPRAIGERQYTYLTTKPAPIASAVAAFGAAPRVTRMASSLRARVKARYISRKLCCSSAADKPSFPATRIGTNALLKPDANNAVKFLSADMLWPRNDDQWLACVPS